MIKDVIEAIISAARKMIVNWGALLISLLLYAALLAALYFFFTTREATTFQVLLSVLILPLAAIACFFIMQAMGLSYVRIGVGPLYLLRRALRDCWKLLLVSLPLFLLAWLIVYLFDKIGETYFSETLTIESRPRRWLGMGVLWLRIFLLYFALPLTAIHVWISTISEGIGASLKGFGRSIACAFSPRSVLVYLLVVAVFGLIAYFLFFTKPAVKSEWVELWLFGVRLAVALFSIFLGWLLTLGSLAELTARRAMRELES